MNTMNFIVWLFPVIFMIHDFEEVIMTEVWGRRYKKEIDIVWPKRQPFGIDYIHVYQTPTFTIGVVIEFLLFSLISFFSVFFQSYFLWYSAFFGITLHLVLAHMFLCIRFKHYVPGIITSIVFILPSIWILYVVKIILHYNMLTIFLTAAAGILLMIIIIPVLHKAMESWSKSLQNYSEMKG